MSKHRMPPLTPKRLRGLNILLTYLDLIEASGWEGTPYDAQCSRPGDDTKRDKEDLQAAIEWLTKFHWAKSENRAQSLSHAATIKRMFKNMQKESDERRTV